MGCRGRGGGCDSAGPGERTELLTGRKPHVGTTRGGRSLRLPEGEEDPAELKADSVDPKGPVPLREAGETPASGGLALPPFPSRARGAGIARGAWGETRQVGPRPRRGSASRPLHPSSGRGCCWARPVRAHAGTQVSRAAGRFGGGAPAFTFCLGRWTCASPGHSCT